MRFRSAECIAVLLVTAAFGGFYVVILEDEILCRKCVSLGVKVLPSALLILLGSAVARGIVLLCRCQGVSVVHLLLWHEQSWRLVFRLSFFYISNVLQVIAF